VDSWALAHFAIENIDAERVENFFLNGAPQVGRFFPALPTYMRLTIGKKSEMETFLTAFREVIA
jgi:histidinol-phosphate/aromatic aminotransferase/cobyric acid decarboxylase-like protein